MVMTFGVPALRGLRGRGIMNSIKTNLGCRVRIISQTKDKSRYAHVTHSFLKGHLEHTFHATRGHQGRQTSTSSIPGASREGRLGTFSQLLEPVCLSAWFSPTRTPRCDRLSTALPGMTSFISGSSACNFNGTGCCSGASQLQVSIALQVLLQWPYSAVTERPGPVARTERPHRPLIKSLVYWPSNTVLITYTIKFPPVKA